MEKLKANELKERVKSIKETYHRAFSEGTDKELYTLLLKWAKGKTEKLSKKELNFLKLLVSKGYKRFASYNLFRLNKLPIYYQTLYLQGLGQKKIFAQYYKEKNISIHSRINKIDKMISKFVNNFSEWLEDDDSMNKKNLNFYKYVDPEKPIAIPRPISKKNFIKLLAYCWNTKWRMILLTQLICGNRKSEVLSLKKEWIDYDMKQIYHPNTKKGKFRAYFFEDEYFEILKEWVKVYPDSEWIFPKEQNDSVKDKNIDDPIQPQTYHIMFDEARKKAKLDYRHPFHKDKFRFSTHSIRQTFCLMLLRQGIKPVVVQKLMGHSKLETTMSYYAYIPDQESKEAICSIFGGDSEVKIGEKETAKTSIQKKKEELQNKPMNPIEVLQLKLINDEITPEAYRDKLKIINEETEKANPDYFG